MAYTPIKLAASLSGNTDGVLANISTGTLYLAGGNNVTLSQNGNSVTFSGPHTSQFLTTAALSQNTSNYAGIGETVGTVAGTDLGLTVNTDGVSIKHPNWLTTAALSNHSHGDPTLALTNLSGTTASASNGFTISLSAAAAGGGAAFSAGASTGGNTLGQTGTVSNQMILVGGSNVTLSQATGGTTPGMSNTITINAANSVYSAGVSTGGNTSGGTGVVNARMVFAGGNNITLSQTVDAGFSSGTITISGPNPGAQSMEYWQNMGVNGSATDAMAQTGTSHGQLKVFQLDIGNNIFAGNMSVNTMLIDLTCNRTATIPNFTWKLNVGIYTLQGSGLYLLYSASTAISSSQSSGASFTISNIVHGKRYLTFNGSTQFTSLNSTGGGTGAARLTLSQGLYYMALNPISSSNSFSASFFGAILGESGQRSGTFGNTQTVGTMAGAFPWMGCLTQTTDGMPQSLPNSSLMKTNLEAIFVPHIVFNNLQGQTTF